MIVAGDRSGARAGAGMLRSVSVSKRAIWFYRLVASGLLEADVYPCHAAGFPRTLDADTLRAGDRVAGCQTARDLVRECYGEGIMVESICPLEAVESEPFIVRCCRSERAGIERWNGRFGAVVHWGASSRDIAEAVWRVTAAWREQGDEGSGR